jgi:formyltetrahydrofolate hydrolase
MFVCQASYLFLVLCQLLWEVRKRQSLWKKLGKHCLVTIQVMQSELSSLVISFHKDWDEHKQRIEVPHTHMHTRTRTTTRAHNTRTRMLTCCAWRDRKS